jgi:hypothetical protein
MNKIYYNLPAIPVRKIIKSLPGNDLVFLTSNQIHLEGTRGNVTSGSYEALFGKSPVYKSMNLKDKSLTRHKKKYI